jgi:signal transduction histidine kinase
MRALASVVVIVAAALLAIEITLSPTDRDRWVTLGVFATVAAITGLAGWLLPRFARRFRSLRTTVLLIAIAAVAVAAAAVATSAWFMFLSAHDLRLVLVALALGVALGSVLAVAVAKPLATDLRQITTTASAVAAGNLEARTGIDRPDELGDAARGIDAMIRRLADAEESRRHFVAAVGHDLRTPLTAIRAAVEALQDGVAPDPDRYLTAIAAETEALASMVNDFFLLARLEAGDIVDDRERIDLGELVRSAAAAMTPTADRREIAISVDAAVPVNVQASPRQMSRVIHNLIDNAIRHAPSGGHVCVAVTDGGPHARVVVHDDGPGFSPAFVEYAFEPFTKGDPARGRGDGIAGLGLAITKRVVTAHGGDVWIDPGPGGTIGFRIPAAA